MYRNISYNELRNISKRFRAVASRMLSGGKIRENLPSRNNYFSADAREPAHSGILSELTDKISFYLFSERQLLLE